MTLSPRFSSRLMPRKAQHSFVAQVPLCLRGWWSVKPDCIWSSRDQEVPDILKTEK